MNKKAFTLVELIVVITIISILGTISFVSFQNYASDARDSKTISDLSNAYKKVVLFKTESGVFPKPDNPIEVNAGAGNIITFQGEFGESVKRILDYGETILDSEGNNYKYATNGKFGLSSTIGLLENSTSFFSNQTHAEDSSKFLYFKGDDVLTLFDENNKYVSDDVFDLQKEKIIAYLGQKEKKPEKDILYGKNVIKNIPKNIKINSPHFIPYKSCPAGQFSGSFATYRHGEINNENTETLIVESPRTGGKSVSTGIVLCTDGVAKLVSDRRTYVCDMYYTATSRGCNPTTYESCKEIKTLFPDATSGAYNITPAGGSNMSVTCDMETEVATFQKLTHKSIQIRGNGKIRQVFPKGTSGKIYMINTWWGNHSIRVDLNGDGIFDYDFNENHPAIDVANEHWAGKNQLLSSYNNINTKVLEFTDGLIIQDYKSWTIDWEDPTNGIRGPNEQYNPYGIRLIYEVNAHFSCDKNIWSNSGTDLDFYCKNDTNYSFYKKLIN